MSDMDQERTEPATPRRLEEAREKGHVAKSHDLVSALVVLAAVGGLALLGGSLLGGFKGALSGALQVAARPEADLASLSDRMIATAGAFGLAALPLLGVVLASAVLGHVLQTGPLWSLEPAIPRGERLDPVQGLARLFSLRSATRLGAGLLKAAAIAGVLVWTAWEQRDAVLGAGAGAPGEVAESAGRLAFLLGLRAGLALLGLGVLDWGLQRLLHARDLRMSRAEIREELRRVEGDPAVRERRRSLQRRLAAQQSLHLVATASVVVTGPGELAVALRYRAESESAPVVVAKGRGEIGRRIAELAGEHDVPVIEREDAAADLFRRAEVGQGIPADLYRTAAELVATSLRIAGRNAA